MTTLLGMLVLALVLVLGAAGILVLTIAATVALPVVLLLNLALMTLSWFFFRERKTALPTGSGMERRGHRVTGAAGDFSLRPTKGGQGNGIPSSELAVDPAGTGGGVVSIPARRDGVRHGRTRLARLNDVERRGEIRVRSRLAQRPRERRAGGS